MRYAGFWSRSGALLVDALVVVPIIVVMTRLVLHSRPGLIIVTVASAFLNALYIIYFHGRWGQTIGKMATGIRVIALDGSPIGWRRAFLRHSVDIGFSVLGTIAGVIVISQIPSADLATLHSMSNMSDRINELKPAAFAWIDWAQATWSTSELVVLLTNRERRALHDFIAGTVVVHLPK